MNARSTFLAVLLSISSFSLSACDRAAPPRPAAPEVATLPTVEVNIAGRRFTLEVADDDAERNTGLMHRPSMPADRGMLFVFQTPAPQAFWMKNTLIPLDIAYIDADGRVVNIAQMYPKDLTSVPSAGPVKYAIELNQGIAKKIGLKPGDRIEMPASVK